MTIIKNYIREQLAKAIAEGKEWVEVRLDGLTHAQQDDIQSFVDGALEKSSELLYDRMIIIYTI